MNKWIELLLGLLLVIVPIIVACYSQAWGTFNFWSAAWMFFKGGLFWAIVMIGLLFILLGISDLKESQSKPRPTQKPAHTPAHPAHAQGMQMQTMPVLDMTSHSNTSSASAPKKRKK